MDEKQLQAFRSAQQAAAKGSLAVVTSTTKVAVLHLKAENFDAALAAIRDVIRSGQVAEAAVQAIAQAPAPAPSAEGSGGGGAAGDDDGDGEADGDGDD